MEFTEEFFSGFCKAQNQTRTVLCEFEIRSDGSKVLLSSDCVYGKCSHTQDCLLMNMQEK